MPKDKNRNSGPDEPHHEVSIYLAWCKRCGNCVAFCPVNALEPDEWGCPQMVRPERCTGCRMCEMLCPDFAVSVQESRAPGKTAAGAKVERTGVPGSLVRPVHSAERVAPERMEEDDSGAENADSPSPGK